MEDVEREQVIEFIKQSREDLIHIQQTINNKFVENASYWIGKLVAKHETLIEVLEDDDEEDCEECSQSENDIADVALNHARLAIDSYFKGFKACQK